ncbi:MAG: sensor histidine kinase [Treponema sp.]
MLLIEQKKFLSDINGTNGSILNQDTADWEKAAIEKIEKIINLEKRNQQELRAIIQNLSIPSLASVPFKTVINDLCEQFSDQSGIPCAFFVEQNDILEDFTHEQKHHILRIIQEALNNVRVHAKAEETSVIIRKVEHSEKDIFAQPQHKTIRIMIFDDGTGFDTTTIHAAGEQHFGMSGMEMRAKLLGGTLTITSNPETGTEVSLDVPAY